jgi:Mrp family chromosome partitioning ATPase
MSRNFEILRRLEDSAPFNHDPFLALESEVWPEEPAPPIEEPFYASSANENELPDSPFSLPRRSTAADKEIARLVESLVLPHNGRELRSLVFCEIESGSASSFVCAGTGCGLAERSQLVCLVDANVRERKLSHYLGLGSHTIRKSESTLLEEKCMQLQKNLWFAGTNLITDDNGVLLPVDKLASVLGRLRTFFHYLLFDTQSMNESRDAALFGNLSDGAILVIEAGVTRKQSALRAKEFLEAASVPLIGTILNNRSFPIPESIYRHI